MVTACWVEVCWTPFLLVAVVLQHPPDLNAERQTALFLFLLFFFWGTCFMKVLVFVMCLRFDSWRKKCGKVEGKERGKTKSWVFLDSWENEEQEDSKETGAVIKLFLTLYLPRELKNNINLNLNPPTPFTHIQQHLQVTTATHTGLNVPRLYQTTLSLSFVFSHK